MFFEGLIVWLFVLVAAGFLAWILTPEKTEVSSENVFRALFYSIVAGLTAAFAPTKDLAWLAAPLGFVAMIILSGSLVAWWREEGSEWYELLTLISLAVIFFMVTMSAANAAVAVLGLTGILESLALKIPICVFVGVVGIMVADFFFLKYKAALREKRM